MALKQIFLAIKDEILFLSFAVLAKIHNWLDSVDAN